MICSLMFQGLDPADRFARTLEMWKKLSGGRYISYNNTIYLSERETADTNRALAYMMRSRGAFPEGVDINATLEFYFQICSLQCDADTMSVIAATLANGGICPTTGERVLQTDTVQQVLSVMNSCGMYDYSGEFAFKVGLPAKSGVGGGIMVVVPGLMGFATFSPPLDSYGNSARGVQFCQELSKNMALHYFQIDQKKDLRVRDHEYKADELNFFHYCATGDLQDVKRMIMAGIDVNKADYDGRTALHLAASEGHLDIVKILAAQKNINLNPSDRWGNTPLDDAHRGSFQ